MVTVMARGTGTTVGVRELEAGVPSGLRTTLYDLIATIQDVVEPEDDALVVTTVVSLLRSGRLTMLKMANSTRKEDTMVKTWQVLLQHAGWAFVFSMLLAVWPAATPEHVSHIAFWGDHIRSSSDDRTRKARRLSPLGKRASAERVVPYSVALPSLNYSGSTYSLNISLIYWGRFAHGLANIEFMEGDCDWDYLKIATWVTAFIAGVVTGNPATAATVVTVGDQVHRGLTHLSVVDWFIDNDDYVDRYWGIKRSSVYSNLLGVSQNVRISLLPR